MENPEEDVWAQKAINQLSACTHTLQDLSGAIRYMLDDVMVASDCPQKQDVLTAWNDGHDHVMTYRKFVAEMVEETSDFMYSPDFDGLDTCKRVDYWEALRTTEKDLEKIDIQVFFYRLLSQIEHTEQMIGFLWQHLKNHRDKVLYRQMNGTLAGRGLSIHKKQLTNTRNRLRYEIWNIMKLIVKAVNHPHFTSITNEKQKEYQTKWKAYANQLDEIDVD
jgi:hypothetical protein